MSENDGQWYYDLGDTETDADDPEDVFGRDMRVTTREDVEAGRATVPFDLDPGQMATGFEAFAQGTAIGFADETSVSPANATENLDVIERGIKRSARERVNRVRDVTAEASSRHDEEVQVSLNVETDEGEHSVTMYLGPSEAIETPE